MQDTTTQAQLAHWKSTAVRMQTAINKFCEKNEWAHDSYKNEGYVAHLFSLRNQEHKEVLLPVYRFAKMSRQEQRDIVRKHGRIVQHPTFGDEIRLTWKDLIELLDTIEQL